ncbi:MAG: hypothetical protein QE263_04475 [Vampirovibrionales bacterium]|nr:hypothetical protein [Vampirovibrionales bacterium]
MGFAASTARLLMLTARKSDLELRVQMINQMRMYWSDVTSMMMMAAAADPSAFKPGEEKAIQLEARRAYVSQMEKMLEMDGKKADAQLAAIESEMQAVTKHVTDNAKSFGGLNARG